MGKGLKEFQLCDCRRLRKKPQDAQDDVTELFDLFDAHFWRWKGFSNLDSQRRSSPVQDVDVCVILPAFLGEWNFTAENLLLMSQFLYRCSATLQAPEGDDDILKVPEQFGCLRHNLLPLQQCSVV